MKSRVRGNESRESGESKRTKRREDLTLRLIQHVMFKGDYCVNVGDPGIPATGTGSVLMKESRN